MGSDFRRIFLEALIIAALGSLIGLSVNYSLVLSSFQGRGAPPVEPLLPESLYPSPAGLEQARELLEKGALAVDARSAEAFRQGHIPGAASLPLGDLETALPTFLRSVPSGRTLVVYCSGYGCTDSFDLAVRLMTEGYRDVHVFEGGLPSWSDAGLPIARGGA